MVRCALLVGACLLAACGGSSVANGIDGGGDGGGGGADAACPDLDNDGVTACAGDCDDNDPLAVPGGNEICGDGADNDCDGTADEGCTGAIGTFVSNLTGSDTFPGTQAMPVQTIGKGMANAVLIGGPQTVVVAEGTYAEKVTLADGVNLMGGYHCDTTACDWTRDPAQHPSVIQNVDFEGVLVGAGVTQATVVDGFRIVGQDGTPPQPGSSGVTFNGGSATLRGNTIIGGNVTGGGFAADRSAGITLTDTDAAGALIEGNDITGGPSTNLSAAINFDWLGGGAPLATVTGNTLRGGSGQRSTGVTAWSAQAGTILSDNDILAGPSNGGASIGIELGGHMTIDGNRVNVDQANVGTCVAATSWCAGISSESSTAVITNNIIFGAKGARSAAVVLGEFEVPAGAIVLNANTLNGGGIGLASTPTDSAALVVRIGPCTTCGFNGFVGKVRNNILDGGSNQNRYGILEDPAAGRTMRPELIENNLFWFSPATGRVDVLYRQMPASGNPVDITTLTALNALATPPAAGNLNADPLLDATWHLMTGSPCIDQGTATEAPPVDFEGDPRPSGVGVDIGHDETP